MSDVTCNFCGHGNPEGSKYCNDCGSPLSLTLCSRCEAINSVSATQCYQCGMPLPSAETEEIAIPPAALSEIAQSERLPAKDDPVPVALGERLDQLRRDPIVISHEPQETTAKDRPSLTVALTSGPASSDNDGSLSPLHSGDANYRRPNPNHARRSLLVVILVAVAGAVYWTSLNPTHPPNLRTLTDEGRATAPEPASSAPAVLVEPADNPKQSPTGDSLTAAGSLPSPAVSFESPATGRESISPRAEAGLAPESEKAQAPSQAEATDSLDDGTAKIIRARAADDPRRMVTPARTREQAERDSTATRRLIARELANSPPGDSENKPPPGP